MSALPVSVRRAAQAGVGAVGVFWSLVIVAGLAEPDYVPSRDYVSALASVGAQRPILGVVALLAFGAAYLAVAAVLRTAGAQPWAAALMVGACFTTWVVALARISCPAGAAACGVDVPGASQALAAGDPSRSSLGPHVHGWAVALSFTLVAVAMLLVCVRSAQRGDRRRALGSGLALALSLSTLPLWVAADSPGAGQRLWLGILSGWIVLICWEPLVTKPEEPS